MKLFSHKDKQELWYDISEIDKTNAVYRLIIGERSNGKTYSVIKKVVEEFFKTGTPSAYIRRYSEDIKGGNLGRIFQPHMKLIQKLSKKRYNSVLYRNNTFYFTRVENNKTVDKSEPVMFTCALNNWERSKGPDRGEIKYFIFDEFMTRASYLNNEFSTFANVHSSFVRARPGVVTYLLANTVNRYSIYFEEMGLKNVEKMKQGDIWFYNYNNDKLTVAVEYCSSPKSKKAVEYYYAFDNAALKMIQTGEWEEDSYPHLGKDFSVSELTIKFKFFVIFNEKLITGEIHIDRNNEAFIFFHDFGKSNYKIKDTDLVFTNLSTTNVLWLHDFGDKPILGQNEKINNLLGIIRGCFVYNKVYFSTNAVGEVVRNFVKNKYSWIR